MDAIIAQLTNGAAIGTGIKKLTPAAAKLLGGTIPPFLILLTLGQQNALFGSYPDHKDVAPLAIFTAAFGIFFLAHLGIWAINTSRGHKFHVSLGLAFYNLVRTLGFGFRIGWGLDIMLVNFGLASEVFLIAAPVILVSCNLILAQRIFTWRHPVGGNSAIFWTFMNASYASVVGVVIMSVVSGVVPYIYYLSERRYTMCKNVFRVAAILNCVYVASTVSLILLAYVFKPTTKDKNITVYQPWWLDSFSTFHFVPKGAAKEAERTFMARDHHSRYAVRVIAAHQQHYNTVEESSDVPDRSRPNLSTNHSIVIVTVTTFFLLLAVIFRTIACFGNKTKATETWVHHPVLMYVMWGALEVLINVIYLVFRVDLRFYKPDRLPKDVQVQTGIQTPSEPYGQHEYSNEKLVSHLHEVTNVGRISSAEKERVSQNSQMYV
ncbi:hypothetical protein BABINDRAFT_161909 [Babjeviella inositovora NRRL Y-12698]|uniref:Uncharacterized protein n=1 Tax=Babjeviella inositovora NRRL Y-12698 TaxID=984486 RepID=A0A1E3QPE8_9ASCO|nr:uncharacterized protein BABINDRAFT_161909 [Babjeviella inositovora NRRL Y-12698]ODQ79518.1 hypothetical protein BABINDRAFT_161909 [Babjeviella inositovora NRRL Y-12698]